MTTEEARMLGEIIGRMDAMEARMDRLEGKVDKLLWGVFGLLGMVVATMVITLIR